jgi:uracil-DNA glycosylase family 4
MTAQEKSALFNFLSLAEDYLRDGYKRSRPEPIFSDDQSVEAARTGSAAAATQDTAAPATDLASANASDSLSRIGEEVGRCRSCPLGALRTMAVPGEGVPQPSVLVVGEGPGKEEDASGRPFVGPAGQYLDKMLASIGLSRQTNCFIANVVKCRPPHNRDPAPEETAACSGFFARQLDLLKPKIILTVGRIPTQALLESTEGIGKLRGKIYTFCGYPLIATYHPSALLRDPNLKRPAWEDLKELKAQLDRMEGSGVMGAAE